MMSCLKKEIKEELAYADFEPPFKVKTINNKKGSIPPIVVCSGPGDGCSHCQVYQSSALVCSVRIPTNGSEIFLCGKADKNQRP